MTAGHGAIALLLAVQALTIALRGTHGQSESWPSPSPSGITGTCQASAVCTAQLLRDLSQSYNSSSYNDTQKSLNAQVAVNKFLVTCLGGQATLFRPVSVLVVTQYSPRLAFIANLIQSTIGLTSKVTVLSSSRLVQEVQNNALRNVTGIYDLVIYSNKYLADFGRMGLFVDLTPSVGSDTRVNWADLTLYYRDSAVYDGKLVGLPLQGVTYALYYRRDILQANGIQHAPATWDDVATLAERFNGTDFNGDGKPDWAVCHVLSLSCQAPHILLDIATNILQYQGPTQGCLYDPLTLEPLVSNPGFAKAMDIYRRLARVNPLYVNKYSDYTGNCNQGIDSFLNGTCLFTVQNSAVFKGTLGNSIIWGKTGSTMVPGFTEVYDRSSKQLVTCTPQRCPYAQLRTLLNGSQAHVNYAPWKGTAGYSGSIFNEVPTDYQTAAFNYLALGASSNFTWADVMDKASSAAPLRQSMITGSDAYNKFISSGYHSQDTSEWLSTVVATLNGGNAVLAAGLPSPDAYQTFFEDAAFNITYRSLTPTQASPDTTAGWNSSISDVQQLLHTAIVNLIASQGPVATLRGFYWAALGLRAQPSPSPVPPPPKPTDSPPSSPTNSKTDTALTGAVLAAVVVPIVLAAVGGFLLIKGLQALGNARKRSMLGRKVKAPGPGPETTLLITDVEGSTTLFEDLDAVVMDDAMGLHHKLIRELSLKHSGYEWATEGDSFLLAFHSPTDAVLFATELQTELMHCPWPEPVLNHALGSTVFIAVTSQLHTSQTQNLKPHRPKSFSVWGHRNTKPTSMHSSPSVMPSRFSEPPLSPGRSLLQAATTAGTPFDKSSITFDSPDITVHKPTTFTRVSPDQVTLDTNPPASKARRFRAAVSFKGPMRGETGTNDDDPTLLPTAKSVALQPGHASPAVLCTSDGPAARAKSAASLATSQAATPGITALHPLPSLGTAASLLDLNPRHSTTQEKLPTMATQSSTVSTLAAQNTALSAVVAALLVEQLEQCSPLAEHDNDQQHVLLFRGLRVRIGMHSGVAGPIRYNPSSGRVVFSGPAVQMARAVQGAACGGMTLISEITFEVLPVETLHTQLLLGYEGEHCLEGVPEKFASQTLSWRSALSEQSYGTPIHLYSAVPRGLVYRAPRMAGRIRNGGCLTAGYLMAPYGAAAVIFMNVVGVPSLKLWNAEILQKSVALYQSLATCQLTALGGYLLESVDGMLLAAFPHPAPAIRWALGVIADCLEADWDTELLEHELGEEVAIQGVSELLDARINSTRLPLASVQEAGVLSEGSFPIHRDRTTSHPTSTDTLSDGGAKPAPAPRRTLQRCRTQDSLMRSISSAQSEHRVQRTLLFRGLRIKAGIDFGAVMSDLHATTGRVTYRGRVLNRASRIAGVAKTGQVWASEEAWARCRSCINDPEQGWGVLEHAQGTLRLRVTNSSSFEVQHAAQQAACQAGHTARTVTAMPMPVERLKGVNEEVPIVALSLSNDEGLVIMPAKDTVMRTSAQSSSFRSSETSEELDPRTSFPRVPLSHASQRLSSQTRQSATAEVAEAPSANNT